jgi:hypothetical protein
MPVEVRRLTGEPIIHARFTGYVEEKDVLQMFKLSSELARDITGRVYRITETRDILISFEELMRIVKRMGVNTAGATADPRFRAILVGSQEETRVLSQEATQKGLDVPLFDSLDQALNYLRWQIQTEH